jgi:thymidylate kinase
MIIVCEGQDNTGKSTLIRYLQDRLYATGDIPVHCLHYSNIRTAKTKMFQKSYSHYKGGFDLIRESLNNRHLIFDRFHLGEYVYSEKYRGYDGSYVFDLEKNYENFLNQVYLVVLTDSPENLIRRDDGLSLSNKREDIIYERERFIDAYNKSIIKNKIHIDIQNLNISSVQNKVNKFIFNNNKIDLGFDEQEEIDDG